MANPRYLRPNFKFCLSHAIEECGEFLAAAGKTQRWGALSVNPELPPSDQERNVDWLRREMRDVRGAMERLLAAIRVEYPDPLLDRAEEYMDSPPSGGEKP